MKARKARRAITFTRTTEYPKIQKDEGVDLLGEAPLEPGAVVIDGRDLALGDVLPLEGRNRLVAVHQAVGVDEEGDMDGDGDGEDDRQRDPVFPGAEPRALNLRAPREADDRHGGQPGEGDPGGEVIGRNLR